MLARLFTASFILTSNLIFINLLNSWVLFNLFNFCVVTKVFKTCSLVLGTFLSTSSAFYTKHSLSESNCILVTSPLVLGILLSIALTFVTNSSYKVFLTTLLSTTLFSWLKSAGTDFNLYLFYPPKLLNKLKLCY